MIEQEFNHMLHYSIMIFHRHLKMSMGDGLVEKLCKTLNMHYLVLFPRHCSRELRVQCWIWYVICECRKDFSEYADVCFREFGDRVKYWGTVNEPNVFTQGGYDAGDTPPQRCSPPFAQTNCTGGNSSTEPYIAAHHILLAHASTVRLYRKSYQVFLNYWYQYQVLVLWGN